MRVLALDFDGVVSDSAPECYLVALRVHCEQTPGSGLRDEAERCRVAGRVERTAVERSATYRAFVEAMPLGNRAEDFGVVLQALERGVALPDQAAYDDFRDGFPSAWQETFHRRFYELRHAWVRDDPEEWLGLLSAYPAFLEILRRRAGDVTLALATAKDRESVRRLLVAYGIDDLLPERAVLDKEAGTTKRAHLEELSRRLAVPCDEITFVDDKVKHLESVAGLGVRCALAAWGYNGEREHARARSRGFLVCSLADVEERLFGGGTADNDAL